MRKARLLKWAEFLEQLPPKRWDYGHWVGKSWQGAPDLSCGTTACALGWACTIHSFRKLGLRMGGGAKWDRTPMFMRQVGSAACALFFDIPHDTAACIVQPGHFMRNDATAKQVAKLIRWVATGNDPEDYRGGGVRQYHAT